MIDHKTGGFFRLVLRMMEVASPAGRPTSGILNLVTLMGRFYQIRDDYQNLVSEEVGAPLIEPCRSMEDKGVKVARDFTLTSIEKIH